MDARDNLTLALRKFIADEKQAETERKKAADLHSQLNEQSVPDVPPGN